MSFNPCIRECGGLPTGRSIGGGRDKSGPTVACLPLVHTSRWRARLTLIFRGIIIRVWGNPSICCCTAPAGVQERRGAMATGALMIGWGHVVPGREQKSLQVFNEAIQYYTQLQQQGTIESFEPVTLEPHCGDLH